MSASKCSEASVLDCRPAPVFRALACDGRRGVVAGADASGGCWTWDAATGGAVRIVRESGGAAVEALAFAPDGSVLAAGDRSGVVTLYREGGLGGTSLSESAGALLSLAWSDKGTRLASGSDDGELAVWDTHTGARLGSVDTAARSTGFGRAVRAIAWQPGEECIAVCTQAGAVQLWDPDTSTLLRTLRESGSWAGAVAFSPRGELLAAGGLDGVVRLYDLGLGGRPTPQELRGHGDAVQALAFSADGTRLATAGRDRSIRIWSMPVGTLRATCTGLGGWIGAVAFSLDGSRVLGADADAVAGVWEADSGRSISRVRRADPEGAAPVVSCPSAGSPRAWEREAARHDWPTIRCGCPRGARHVPGSFATLLAARTESEAKGTGLLNDVEVQSMLFEAAVPVTSMTIAALGEEGLPLPVRRRLLYLLLILVSGESHHTEADLGRPDLDVECQEAARAAIPLLHAELAREGTSGTTSDLASEILEVLGDDSGT